MVSPCFFFIYSPTNFDETPCLPFISIINVQFIISKTCRVTYEFGFIFLIVYRSGKGSKKLKDLPFSTMKLYALDIVHPTGGTAVLWGYTYYSCSSLLKHLFIKQVCFSIDQQFCEQSNLRCKHLSLSHYTEGSCSSYLYEVSKTQSLLQYAPVNSSTTDGLSGNTTG